MRNWSSVAAIFPRAADLARDEPRSPTRSRLGEKNKEIEKWRETYTSRLARLRVLVLQLVLVLALLFVPARLFILSILGAFTRLHRSARG